MSKLLVQVTIMFVVFIHLILVILGVSMTVSMPMRLKSLLPEEGQNKKPSHVERSHHSSQSRHSPGDLRSMWRAKRHPKDLVFREKPRKRGYSADCEPAYEEHCIRRLQVLPKTTHLQDILLVVHPVDD